MTDTTEIIGETTTVSRLTKQEIIAARGMSTPEVRFLVDRYYIAQKNRIRSDNQIKALTESEEPCLTIQWLTRQDRTVENQIKRALDAWSLAHPVGEWARAQVGVGPVIAAGLLAHIDIKKAPTVGHIWSFAGLNPTVEWLGREGARKLIAGLFGAKAKLPADARQLVEKAIGHRLTIKPDEKISRDTLTKSAARCPWNPGLKVLCWKLGESFMKQSGREDCYYGAIYTERKALEIARNEAGVYADQARHTLATVNIGKGTEAYEHYSKGRLPPARILLRAERYAVKMFLAHLHDVWYRHEFKRSPPRPYVIEYMDHAHVIPPPAG